MDEQRMAEVLGRYEDWWQRRNDDAVLSIIYPRRRHYDPALIRPWMSPPVAAEWSMWQQEFLFGQAAEIALRTGDLQPMDDAIDFLAGYPAVTGNAADGYPFLNPTAGPGCLSALMTGFTRFQNTTIWLELDEPLGWDALFALGPQARSPYADIIAEGLRRVAERLREHYVIGTPDLGGLMDTLAAMHGNQNLLMACLEAPESVEKALHMLEAAWFRYYEEFSDIVNADNHGCYTIVMRYLSARPVNVSICDASAMLSPAMFRDLVLPFIGRETDYFDGRVVYHLDGPGELPHVSALCSLPKLHAIQWVPGAGNPDTLSERWDDLYESILDAGKRICLGGAPTDSDRLRRLFAKFPKREFLVPLVARDEAEAKALAALR